MQVILKSLDTASLPFSLPSVAAPPVVRDSAWSDVRRWIYIAATAIAVVTIAGVTTSAVFNRGLGRLEFAPEPLFTQIYWGVRAMIAPTGLGVIAIMVLGVVSALAKGPIRMAAPLTDRLMPPSTRTRALAAIHHIPMAVIAPVLLVVQLIMMVFLWRWFEPLIWTLVSFINQSFGANGPDTLGALNPNNLALHRSFRQQFSLHLLIFTAAWLQVLRLRAQRADYEARIVVAAGLALTLLALLFLVAPFRIMRHNEAERVALGPNGVIWSGSGATTAWCFVRPSRRRGAASCVSTIRD